MLAALVGPLTRFVNTSASWLEYPYARPGSEGLIAYESLLLKHGGDIYSPITPQSFISGPYPPLYYWIAAGVMPDNPPDLTNPSHISSIFQPGRTISLFSAIAAAVLLALLVIFEGGYRAQGRQATAWATAAGIVGGALFLTLPQTLVWATRFRADMLMAALTAGGLVCVVYSVQPLQDDPGQNNHIAAPKVVGHGWSLLLAAVLFSLAFFTKQTAVAGPAAAALYLLLCDWRAGLRWCGLMLGLVALPFAALDIATGHWFYLKMVVYHSLPLVRATFTRLLHFAFWDEEWPLAIAASGYALYRLVQGARSFKSGGACTTPLLVPLFLVVAAATLPAAGVAGADHNHLLLIGLAVCAGVAALLAALFTHTFSLSPAANLALSAAASLLVIVYAAVTSAPSPTAYGPDLAFPSPQEQEQLRKIALYVREAQGEVFYTDDTGILAVAGKKTPYDDPFTMTALANSGRWDESALRTMLGKKEFSRLILSCDVAATLAEQKSRAGGGSFFAVAKPCRADIYTPGVLDAINSGYKIIFRDVLFTYAPR